MATPASIEMYHVTNVPRSSSKPNWTEINLCIPNDPKFDGLLEGLPVACFTTTRFSDGLPENSPYPRSAKKGQEHWRVITQFVLQKYRIFEIHKVNIQVHLLCLDETDMEKHLTEILLYTHPDWELKDREKYFPNGKPNTYPTHLTFVNVHFIHPVELGDGVQWDEVEKGSHSHAPLNHYPDDTDLREQLVDWVIDLVKNKYPDNVPPEVSQHLQNFQTIINESTSADESDDRSDPISSD